MFHGGHREKLKNTCACVFPQSISQSQGSTLPHGNTVLSAEIVHWVSSSRPQKNFLMLHEQIKTITSDAIQLAGAEMGGWEGGVIITEAVLVNRNIMVHNYT